MEHFYFKGYCFTDRYDRQALCWPHFKEAVTEFGHQIERNKNNRLKHSRVNTTRSKEGRDRQKSKKIIATGDSRKLLYQKGF